MYVANNRTRTEKTKKKVCVSGGFVSWMTKLVFLFVCKWNCQSFNSYFFLESRFHSHSHTPKALIHTLTHTHIYNQRNTLLFWLHTIRNTCFWNCKPLRGVRVIFKFVIATFVRKYNGKDSRWIMFIQFSWVELNLTRNTENLCGQSFHIHKLSNWKPTANDIFPIETFSVWLTVWLSAFVCCACVCVSVWRWNLYFIQIQYGALFHSNLLLRNDNGDDHWQLTVVVVRQNRRKPVGLDFFCTCFIFKQLVACAVYTYRSNIISHFGIENEK